MLRLMRITGLGRGLDSVKALSPDAMGRVLKVLADYRGLMDQNDVQRARMVGTSALRDAGQDDRASFCRAAEDIIGVPLELLSGDEEAALSFQGATTELAAGDGPWFVADIGGGSSELVVGPEPSGACSLPLGCVRVTERFLHHDPPAKSELARASTWLWGQCRQAAADVPALLQARRLVGLAGTVSALACLDQGLVAYDRDAVHHYRLSRPAVDRRLQELANLPATGRALRPGIEAARAPFVVGGALVLATLMAWFGFEECLVSESDILDGMTWALRSATHDDAGPASPPRGASAAK